jgi:Polyketide cyclase / dehydrase and lipid transport
MKLTAKTDLEAPVEFLHAYLCDNATWEREATRRGVEVERPADMPLTGVGAGWRIRVPFRGRVRKVLLRVDDIVRDETIAFSFEGQAMVGTTVLEFKPLSPRRCRLKVTIDAKPKTLAARLFLNTLRLARRKVEERFEKRVRKLGARVEERFAREKV